MTSEEINKIPNNAGEPGQTQHAPAEIGLPLISEDVTPLEERVKDILKTCYDPEIPVNIYELGLIYEVRIEPTAEVNVKMTLTSPNCPVAGSLPVEVRE